MAVLGSLPNVYHNGQPGSKVFWRTLLTDTAGVAASHAAPDEYGLAFTSWIKDTATDCEDDMAQHIREQLFPNPYGILTEAGASSRVPLPSDGLSSIDQNPTNADEYEAAFSHARHLRVFLTGTQYLEVGSASVLQEDSI